MNFINQFLNEHVSMLLYTTLTSIISYIGIKIKKSYESYLIENFKKEQANTVCRAIEQVYSNLSNEEKLIKATETLKTIFAEKNIKISDLELRLLIECAIHTFKVPTI